MKITLDHTEGLRAAAEKAVDDYFNHEAIANAHRDQEHDRKKKIAADILSGGDHAAPPEFIEEAQLTGVTITDLANTIQSKPDDVMNRIIRRRRALVAARRATTVDELNNIIAAHSSGQVGP